MNYKQLIVLIFSLTIVSCAQVKQDTLFVAHWNLENLFDTVDDPKTFDEEFLPNGQKEWTPERLDKKLYNLSRVIRSMNNDRGPDILGVCEVEHEALLDTMCSRYLSDKKYDIAYLESPDERGIDNGLIFNSNKLSLISVEGLTVDLGTGDQTRLILFAKLLLDKIDTLNCFVDHWPSRRGGQSESEWARIKAAQTLRKTVDDLLNKNKNSNIIIVGDFNDEPNNISITENLRGKEFICDSVKTENLIEDKTSDLFNLAYKSWANGNGSYFYRDNFNMLDQIIVSKSMLIGNELNYICNSFEVYKPEMMVTRTGKYKGAPFPTYGGSRYLGGYSDHFPVTAKFKILR
jgi:endonuclease/exonuclease/phosphatase family metal-dependent hydrolase